MRAILTSGFLALLHIPMPASAHRLDEYLQAAMLSIDASQVRISLRLVPGVAVAPGVISQIDSNRDGAIDEMEANSYVQRVLLDLSLRVDGQLVPMHPTAYDFSPVEELREGVGQIQIAFVAQLPSGFRDRALIFENHHFPAISVYMMNTFVPGDKATSIARQNRNQNQSTIEVDFVDARRSPRQRFKNTEWLVIFCGFFPMFLLLRLICLRRSVPNGTGANDL